MQSLSEQKPLATAQDHFDHSDESKSDRLRFEFQCRNHGGARGGPTLTGAIE